MPLKKNGEPFEEHISNLHVSIAMNISICFSELPIEGKLSDKDIYHNDHNRHPWEIQTMNHVSHNVSGIARLYPSARLLTEILLADLPYKLRCYTRISSPEKSRNNTREKIWYFLWWIDRTN